MSDLKVDFCSYEAAKWAVEKWHYSKVMPAGKTVKLGVWEDGEFVGAIVFSWGANHRIGSPYNLKMIELCELVRVALCKHISPVSRIVTIAIKIIRQHSPGLRLIVSYADPEQGHIGAIYQAMNWVYIGSPNIDKRIFEGGRWVHRRTIHERHGVSGTKGKEIKYVWKHKYLYSLDRAMRRQIAPLAKPYPKRESVRLTKGSTSPPSEGWQFDSDPAALHNLAHT